MAAKEVHHGYIAIPFSQNTVFNVTGFASQTHKKTVFPKNTVNHSGNVEKKALPLVWWWKNDF